MSHATAATARVPYRAALAVFATVFAGYLVTLAPTVTFWDAGELIAASRILGIPHPPGTPLFVLMGNVWGSLLPFGSFAYLTNLMTAMFSAGGAALLFLLVAQALRGWAAVPEGAEVSDLGDDRVFVLGGAAAAALISAFAFTVWQNSNETEVYMVATFSIAAISWLAWLWRRHRGGERAPHVLLLIVYLAAVSVGAHLLTLLVGPALIGFMAHVLRTEPLRDEADRRTERAQMAVVAGVWALLIGVGLGNTTLLAAGGVIFAAAAVYAAAQGALLFALSVLAIAVVGVSTYLFLLIRAGVGPFINEADPSTWRNLWAVIAREQYPPRSPIDNPIYTIRQGGALDRIATFVGCLPALVDGPVPPQQAAYGIPECYTVRSIPLMLRQAYNYLQYFDWQWSMGLAPGQPLIAWVRIPFTFVFTSLGFFGLYVLRKRDRSLFWLLLLLFLITGPGLVGYMNFKPGYSLFWNLYDGGFSYHEVRERDYFFTVSFLAWGLFAGIGLAGLYRLLRAWLEERGSGPAVSVRGASAVLVIALIPFALNFGAAGRARGPEARLAHDFAYDLLQSVEPYGIVFTNGDNDTFPLWYLQEVEEVRRDVSVVNLSLGNTDWYLRQLRDNPIRPFDPEQAPWFAPLAPAEPPPPILSWPDAVIDSLNVLVYGSMRPSLRERPDSFPAGRRLLVFQQNSAPYVHDVLVVRLIQENWQRRPIYFSLTAGSDTWQRAQQYLTQEGLALRFHPDDTSLPAVVEMGPGLFGIPVDIPRTDSLLWNVYRFAGLFDADTLQLDPTNRNITYNLSQVFYAVGLAHRVNGNDAAADSAIAAGFRLWPNQQLVDELARVSNMIRSGSLPQDFLAPAAEDDTLGPR